MWFARDGFHDRYALGGHLKAVFTKQIGWVRFHVRDSITILDCVKHWIVSNVDIGWNPLKIDVKPVIFV